MKYLKLFENFENDELDYDAIQAELKNHGWGDLSLDRFEDFENSEYYSGCLDTDQYADEMNAYMHDISTGDIDEEDEEDESDPYIANLSGSWKRDDYSDLIDQNDDNNIDLSIELENKLRTIPSDSEMNVDDFLSEFGVKPEDMTGFAWASILNGAQQYKEMTDEEFFKLYDEYKNSLNESKKSGVTASLKKKAKASGIPMGILRKVFAKGMQAWNAGHRPGVAQHQWGMGRVNSFITGAGGARKADADLWTKAKAAKARKKKK